MSETNNNQRAIAPPSATGNAGPGFEAKVGAFYLLTLLIAGVATGYLCGRYVQSQLFGIDADDPLVFGVAIAALLGASAAATILPAVRASRIDPLRALRHD